MIEKFPALGEPLILLWGLLTVPTWGYRCMSMAMTDVMVADLPHVLYGKQKERVTEEDIEKANELQKALQERKKTGFAPGMMFDIGKAKTMEVR